MATQLQLNISYHNLLNDTFSTAVEWEYKHERQVRKDVECSGRGHLKHYISSSSVAMRKNLHSLSLGQIANPRSPDTATKMRHQENLKGRPNC
jgi:hypothetical protein